MSLYKDIVLVKSTGKIVAKTHEGQTRALSSPARMVFMISGAQGGKTILGPLWLYNEIRRLGSGDYLAVTSNFGLFKLKMLPAMIELFQNILHIGKYWPGLGVLEIAHPKKGFLAKSQHDSMYARVLLRTAAAKSGLESATAKAAWLDECGQDEFKYEAWEAVQRRLSIHQGRVLGTTTPYNLGWLKTFVYDLWEAGDSSYDVIQFASTMNPKFPKEEFERVKNTLPEWRFRMFYEGRFARPSGLIYKEFSEESNLSDLDIENIPVNWPRIIGVDFGGANNAQVHLCQDVETKIWHAYMEVLEGGISTKQHVANTFPRLKGATNFRAVGGAPSETQPRKDWTSSGLKVEQPPVADIEVGISNVIELFKTGALKIHKSLGGLRHELATYQRVTNAEGVVSNEIKDKHTFHKLDALRYACSIIAKPKVRLGTTASQANYLTGK